MSRRRNVTKAFISVISRSRPPPSSTLTSLARKLALCDQALDSRPSVSQCGMQLDEGVYSEVNIPLN